jgi:O-antigen/teichoic acid export membrane protein
MTGDADTPIGGQYSGRVLILFATSVLTTGIAFLIGLMLARLLGPAGKGDFYLLTLLPATLTVLIQLGLPQAFGYFAARGQTVGINAKSVVLTVALGFPALLVTILLIPILRTTIMDFLDPYEIILGVCVLPLLLMATFTTGTLLGRQAVRWYASVNIGLTIASLCIYVTIVGILGFGLVGALWAAVLVACIGPAGYLIGSMRATRRIANPQRVTYRELLRYGLPLYPGNLTQYFSARVDVYLLAWLLPNPAAPLGLYSMAVTMAQTVFFFPTAVSTIFFPYVVEASREDSGRHVAMVSRVTLIVTAGFALALAPAATVMIHVILPAFEGALPAFYILLPAIVSLSLVRVLSSYLAGLAMTGWLSSVNVASLGLNVVANLILIPPLGIVGAALASLISYSASALALSVRASRLSEGSVSDFWIPRPGDVRFAFETTLGLGRRLMRRGRAA